MSVSDVRLSQIAHRFGELEARLASGTLESDAFVAASRDYAELEPVARAAAEVVAMRGELASLQGLEDPDPDMRALAAEEIARLRDELPAAERRLALAMLPRDSADIRPAMLEIRAGTGGEEASLFAAELYRMYSRYAEGQGWRVEVLSANATGLGGFKEIIALIEGQGAYSKLKFEGGVHRVQRVPVTEGSGRIHTSAVTVAVLPEAEDVEVDIDEAKELRIDVYRSSGPGGQSVNTTDSAVRVTHLPTGLVVSCQDEKSQHKNKAKALKILRARLLERAQAEQQAEQAQNRRNMVGSGDRSERVRTYNFPQGRVTDHRINLTLYSLDRVLEGDVAPLIDGLITHFQAEQLQTAS